MWHGFSTWHAEMGPLQEEWRNSGQRSLCRSKGRPGICIFPSHIHHLTLTSTPHVLISDVTVPLLSLWKIYCSLIYSMYEYIHRHTAAMLIPDHPGRLPVMSHRHAVQFGNYVPVYCTELLHDCEKNAFFQDMILATLSINQSIYCFLSYHCACTSVHGMHWFLEALLIIFVLKVLGISSGLFCGRTYTFASYYCT